MGSHQTLKIEKFEAPQGLKTAAYAFIFIGLIGVVLGLIRSPERFWTSYLVSFFFFASMAMGGMFFLAVSNAAKAGWHSSIKRIPESFTNFIPVMIVASLFLIFGFKELYAWADPSQAHRMTGGKALYLAPWFVALRLVLFGIGSFIFAKLIVGNSLKQDQTGDVNLTHKNVGNSIGFIAFFAIFFSLFSFDLLMSLLPSWYSTIYGIYMFSGMIQSFFALTAIILVCFKNSKWISGYMNTEHQHDIGKFMFGRNAHHDQLVNLSTYQCHRH